jgi:hypothetical protein
MPKQFKAEIINYQREHSIRERELILKTKKYIESLAYQIAHSSDCTNIRHLLEQDKENTADILHRVLRASVDSKSLKQQDIKNEILDNSAACAKYLLARLEMELNDSTTENCPTLDDIEIVDADSFSNDDMQRIIAQYKQNV